MSKRVACLFGAVATVTMMTACDEPREGECGCGDEISVREVQTNTYRLNTTRLNTVRLNTARLNTVRLNGPDNAADYIELKKIVFKDDKFKVTNSWLVGSTLNVNTDTGGTFAGSQIDSTKLRFEVSEGGVTSMRVLKVLDVEPLAPGSDIMLYDLALKVDVKEWIPLCEDNAGEPTQAILLEGSWDPVTGARADVGAGGLTFACRDTALAKCAEWGYRPWASADGESLRDYHQACTRMVRADYCGNGVSHTVHGTPIHVLDQRGIQTLDASTSFVVEAEWGPGGAVCVNGANLRSGAEQYGCEIPACGDSFASGGLIQSGKIVAGP